MPTTFSISPDCKTMSIIGGPANAEYSLYHNNFLSPANLYSLQDPTLPYNGNINPSTGNPINGYISASPPTLSGSGSATLTYQNIESATEEALNGVWMLIVVDPVDSSITHVYGAIGHCDIDCCIVSKLEDLLKCSCDKDCSEFLDTISKIYLLIHGASINVLDCLQTAEQYQRAYEKYLKAKSMCSVNECKCSC
jgi:hypothetical protein